MKKITKTPLQNKDRDTRLITTRFCLRS